MSAKDNTLDRVANTSVVNYCGTLIVCNIWWEIEGTRKSVCVSLYCAFSTTNLIQKEQKSITVWFCCSRWAGFPKSGRREQRFPPTLSPCWITSPQTCTPCLSSVLPSPLWTVRAALHGLILRASTSPSTGRWVHVGGLVEMFVQSEISDCRWACYRFMNLRRWIPFKTIQQCCFLLHGADGMAVDFWCQVSCSPSKHFYTCSPQFVYEDSMDLIAKLPCIAAKIYRNLYREGSSIGAIDSNLDWSHNFTNMLGYGDAQFTELMRLYLTIHRYSLKHQIIN